MKPDIYTSTLVRIGLLLCVATVIYAAFQVGMSVKEGAWFHAFVYLVAGIATWAVGDMCAAILSGRRRK